MFHPIKQDMCPCSTNTYRCVDCSVNRFQIDDKRINDVGVCVVLDVDRQLPSGGRRFEHLYDQLQCDRVLVKHRRVVVQLDLT